MDQLSQEIINLIATFIERHPDQPGVPSWERTVLPSNLPQYAAISPAWKHAIERITFRTITLKNTEIQAFDAIFRKDRRRSLTKIMLDVVLPTYDDKSCGRFEREADRHANDEAFTQAIEKLFAVLKSWEEDVLMEGSIYLTIGKIYAPFDVSQRDYEMLQQHRFEKMVGKRHDLFEHRYKHSLIHILRPDRLPTLRRVSGTSYSTSKRNLDMRAVVDMTAKLPSLEDLHWTLHDDEKHHAEIRVTNRHSFASILSTCTFPSLKTAMITFFHESPLNQAMKPADLLGNQSDDPLSTALRQTFSQCPNLTSLDLTGVFDSSIFWPCSQQSSNNTPAPNCWPNLQFLTVKFDPTTPSGHWYFTGPLGNDPEENLTLSLTEEDDSDPDAEDSPLSDDAEDPFDAEEVARLSGTAPINIFRTIPNPTHLNPLILAFANFVQNTASPSLLAATLTTGPSSNSIDENVSQFEICFYAPNQSAYYGDEGIEDQKLPRLYLEVGDWVPDPEVLKGLKEAGKRKWGGGNGELLVRFLEGQY